MEKKTGVNDTPPKRRNTKGRYKEFEVIHDTELFQRLLKRLVLNTPNSRTILPSKIMQVQ